MTAIPDQPPSGDPPAGRGRLVTAFFALGALFFGLAVADRLLAVAAGFTSIMG